MNGTTVKANDKKKRAYKQDQKKTTKDKSNVTCYNYRKKGHYKRECRSPKKGWKLTPGKEIAAIDETTKDVIEVAATSYEDKGSDTDSLRHDGNGEDEQAPNSELVTVDPETGLAEWDMAGEYAPPASILPALGQWGFTVT
ncbi:hypothetical protein MYCTH_2124937 [Thermothelomyces thermophilus ATCC 42464]|uniref:CCHC-type domain-containing protein n=1 Tax=Thermothelomyces thermophilus (strain ATCC 42464 / BCRC 31852 / DSM 1799) TaxID=573729 RepID=G2QB32_THET4|nr:uncharacterized protein MYCTH_2124937 [Thermothelomyces thermophilus ATCC 42464]AEO55970.1 hypothetical protein MYCTH_2124937 [Thermothelomyces thermophilus ATCC 42464]